VRPPRRRRRRNASARRSGWARRTPDSGSRAGLEAHEGELPRLRRPAVHEHAGVVEHRLDERRAGSTHVRRTERRAGMTRNATGSPQRCPWSSELQNSSAIAATPEVVPLEYLRAHATEVGKPRAALIADLVPIVAAVDAASHRIRRASELAPWTERPRMPKYSLSRPAVNGTPSTPRARPAHRGRRPSSRCTRMNRLAREAGD